MDVEAYFRDLSAQLQALQNRVRHLISDAHWPSDGAWKESVLRSVLRGYLPASHSVGTGFILTPDGPSSQIDVLVYDDTAPLFFRDGDFVVVSPDSVRAVIEVKTRLAGAKIDDAIQKLDAISRHLRKRCLHSPPFIGLFAYEPTSTPYQDVLGALKRGNPHSSSYPITAACFGDQQFYRYWQFSPEISPRREYDAWHAYDVPEMAQGYFVHNLVEHLFPSSFERAAEMWYPFSGKETRKVGSMMRKDD